MTKLSSSPRNPSTAFSHSTSSHSTHHITHTHPSFAVCANKTTTPNIERCAASITYLRSNIDGVCVYYVHTEDELQVVSSVLQNAASNIIAVDLEGVHLSWNGPISLLHIFDGKAIFIFDVLHLKETLFRTGGFLTEILSSTTVTKLMFDCRKDSEALYHQYGVKLDNVIDVQMAEIMYRYKIIGDQLPRYFSGLASAVEQYNVLKGSDNYDSYSKLRNIALDKYIPSRGGRMEVWGERPLDIDLLLYCAEDIKSIFRLYIEVFAKKLSYETCIGVSMIRLRETRMTPSEETHENNLASASLVHTTSSSSLVHTTSSPSPTVRGRCHEKCLVNFDVALFSKFEDSMQQYRKLGLMKACTQKC